MPSFAYKGRNSAGETVEGVLEVLVVHAHDDIAEHVDEAAVGVEGKAPVAGGDGRRLSPLSGGEG